MRHRFSPRLAAVGALVSAAALLATTACDPSDGQADSQGQETGDAGALAAFHDQEIEWTECGDGLECAQVEVPLDYDDPDGQRLEIAAARVPAEGETTGSLVVNPGGPGSSGIDYAAAAENVVSSQVRQSFDVVGFDPRGVGASEPIECLDQTGTDAYMGLELEPEDPTNPGALTQESQEELDEQSTEFVEGCTEQAGELLEHMSTEHVARDMDILRAVLGEDELTYLGKSYGTLIGANYAQLFPEQVRALVLDGAVDPTLTNVQMSAQQASGFHTALEAFLGDCVDRDDCPLTADTVEDGVAELDELITEAREEPLTSPEGEDREVNGARVELGLASSLYSENMWGEVRDALEEAFDGDGAGLLALGDRMYDRRPDGNYTNMVSALNAVNCADRPSPESPEEIEDAVAAAAEDAPIFGASLAWGSFVCSQWPVDTDRDAAELTGEGADEILVVGTTRDSATPYAWSENLSEQLDSGVLLTYDGDGHTAYATGDACVDEQVDTYLLEASAPAPETTCPTG